MSYKTERTYNGNLFENDLIVKRGVVYEIITIVEGYAMREIHVQNLETLEQDVFTYPSYKRVLKETM